MKRKEWLLLLAALIFFAGAAYGLMTYRANQEAAPVTENVAVAERPSTQKVADGPYVRLLITRDFGANTMLQQVVPLEENDTVMDVLKRHGGQVETAYGGGFVQSINGLASAYTPGNASSKKLDWFYSVNGITADIGAAEYPLQSGDVVWWDYHDWSYAVSTPAQIGAFPRMFTATVPGNESELLIMAAPGYETQARQLADALAPALKQAPTVTNWNEQKLQEEKSLILIGDKDTLGDSPFLQTLWREKASFGLFAELNQKGIQLFDEQGNKTKSYTAEEAGLLLATVHPESRLPLLIVAGNGEKGVSLGIDTLLAKSAELAGLPVQGYFGLLLQGEEKLRLPGQEASGDQP